MTLRLKQLAREGQISYRYKLYKNGKFLANAAIASIAVSGGLLAAGQTASAATATTDANATSNVTTATTNATSTGTSDFSSTGSSTTSTSAATTTPDATPDATTGSTTTEADSTESGESTPTATASSVTSSSETPATSSDTDTSSAAISSTSTATDVTGASNATSTSATTGSANTAATASTPATTTKAAATTSVPVTSAATKVAETTASRVGDVNTVAGSNAASPATTDSTADVTAASSVADSISTLTSAVDTSSTGSATTDTVTGSSVTAPASTDGATVGVSAAVEAAKQVSTTDVTKLDNVKYDALTNVAKISGELTDAQLADLKDTMLTQSKLSGIMPTIQMNAAAADVVQPTVVVTPDATTMDNTRDFHTFTVNVTYNDANNVLNGGVLKLTTKNGHFTYGINIGDLSLVSSQTFRGNQEYDYSLKDGLASGTSIPITVEMWVDASMNVGGTLDLTATLTGNDGQINTATTADETLTANPDVALTGDNIGGWIEKNSDIPDGYTETLTIPYDASSSYGVTEPENIDPAIYEGVSSAQKDAVSSSKIVITGDKASIDQWVSHQVSGGVYASSVWTSDGRLISLPETVTRDSDTQVTVDLGGLNPQLAYDLTVSHNEVPAGTPGTSYSYSQSTYVNDVRLKTINWTVNTATNPVVYNEFTPNLWLDNAQGSDVVAGKQVTITFNPSIVSDGTQTNTALDMTLPANFKASSFTVPGSLTLDKIQYSTDDSNWNDVDLQVSSDYNNGDQDYSLQSVPTGRIKYNIPSEETQ